jgi:hypothetical protein
VGSHSSRESGTRTRNPSSGLVAGSLIARILPAGIRHDRKAGAFKSLPIAAIPWRARESKIQAVKSSIENPYLTVPIQDVLDCALGNEAIIPVFSRPRRG